MNKQELIDKLASLVGSIEDFKGISTFHDGKYAGLEHALELIQQLDELQNPVESKITDEQAWNKVAEAYPESAQSLRNTLDNAVFGKTGEPQKHVMPKFFDKWAKQVLEKRNKFYAISLITRAGWGYGVDYELGESENPSTTRELLDWLVEDSLYLNKEKATEALLYGYEVEKEPLYRVKIGEGYFVEYQERGALIIPDGNKEIKIFDSKSDAERTAQTIGGTVEEVAEG